MIFNTYIWHWNIYISSKKHKNAGLPNIISHRETSTSGAVLASGGGAGSSGGLAPNCFISSSVGIASCNWERERNPSCLPLYWLFDRDSYSVFLQCALNCLVKSSIYPKQLCFFHCSNCCSTVFWLLNQLFPTFFFLRIERENTWPGPYWKWGLLWLTADLKPINSWNTRNSLSVMKLKGGVDWRGLRKLTLAQVFPSI